jgi:hypothetical protein
MHKYGEADLLYRYQLSYKKAKKDKILEVRIALNISSHLKVNIIAN